MIINIKSRNAKKVVVKHDVLFSEYRARVWAVVPVFSSHMYA